MKRYGVIMAGGSGTRFWPLSRKNLPKQLLNLSGCDLMINETIDRLRLLIEPQDIFIVTNQDQAPAMQKAVSGRIPARNILVEPAARNTAACIGYAAMKIKRMYGDGVMIVLPSDHYVKEREKLREMLEKATSYARTGGKLITIGIEPFYPATGYGYIQFDTMSEDEIKPVLSFHEKPDAETARQYIETGKFKWNSGMFVWNVSTILKKYEELVPDIYSDLKRLYSAFGTPAEQETLASVYPQIRKISVDYAIMEPCAGSGDVRMLAADFSWSDVGSWDMLSVYHPSDENGNVLVGDSLAVNSRKCVCYSQKRLIAIADVEDLAVIETDDAIMVCKASRAQDVRLLVEALEKQGRAELI